MLQIMAPGEQLEYPGKKYVRASFSGGLGLRPAMFLGHRRCLTEFQNANTIKTQSLYNQRP